MSISRRHFVGTLAAATLLRNQSLSRANAAQITPWHEDIARQAKALDQSISLHLLVPNGSQTNVRAATNEFTRLSGVKCEIRTVDVDNINVDLILPINDEPIDVALPATFGIVDLAQAGVILPLNTFADKYEPAGFSEGHLYRKGDYYLDKLYGYQTDGDVYLLFYNKGMIEDPAEIEAYYQATGKVLKPATSWEDLDSMMAFFQRPEKNQYGGNLFRSPVLISSEWWARFHAAGYLPFNKKMQANINNAMGVEVLEQLIAASNSQTPLAGSNNIFESWTEFVGGNVFCSIGWGGTQKYMMSQPAMRDNLVHGPLPGPQINGHSSTMGYFNWGWNYTVSASSTQPELAYLLALFCASPEISTMAVRTADGFFDPFREEHYSDSTIREVYGDSFLQAHRESLIDSIPDLYIRGQSNYLDALRLQIMAALARKITAREALDNCAQTWSHITRRLGRNKQRKEWKALLATYPPNILEHLKNE